MKKHLCKGISLVLALAMTALTLPMGVTSYAEAAAMPTIRVDMTTPRAAFDNSIVSANHRYNANGGGMFDAVNGKVYDDFVAQTKKVNYGLIRYPAGTIGNLFKWKDSIGDVSERHTVILGNNSRGVEFPSYGLDEHMTYVKQIGAGAILMVGEAVETPQDAADLVEYVNAPNDGSNPGGGVDWAAVRAANGHPDPYGVTYFEIGNEMSNVEQRYWLAYPSTTGKTGDANYREKYSLGDTVAVTNEPARHYGTWTDNKTTGKANEEFYSQYYPVAANTETIYVNGTAWTRVSSFAGQSSSAKVYTFDYNTGKITFGDGVHGAIPAKGAAVRMDYYHVHAGFEAYYDAMKAIDPDIVVLSCLEQIYNFVPADKCDGVVEHIYPGIDNASSQRDAHDAYMLRADGIVKSLVTNDGKIKTAAGRNDVVVATTEYGIIGIPTIWTSGVAEEKDEARILSRALHFGTVLIAAAQMENEVLIHQGFTSYSFGGGAGLGSAGNVYNALYAPDPNDPSKFIPSAMALSYEMFGNGHGDTVLNSFVEDNPSVACAERNEKYAGLQVLASKNDDGTTFLYVINRDCENDVTTRIALDGAVITGPASVRTLNGASYLSCNTPDHPNDVAITERTASYGVGSSGFLYSFPAHSVTVLELPCVAESTSAWTANFDLQDFNKPNVGAIPTNIKRMNNANADNTGVVYDPQNGTNKCLKIANTSGTASARIWLSGQDRDAATSIVTGYTGLVDVKFKLKAAENTSRLNISVKDTAAVTVLNLSVDGGMFKCNNVTRSNCEANEWHDVEFLLDYPAKAYMMYIDGEYAHSARTFNNATSKPLDRIVFDVETAGTFYIDDVQTFSMAADGVSVGENTAHLSHTAAQTAATAGKLRFLAAVDSLSYRAVGMTLRVKNGTETGSTECSDRIVYNAVGGTTAANLGINGGYVYALTVCDVPSGSTLAVRPFVDGLDGSRSYGAEETYRYENGTLTKLS